MLAELCLKGDAAMPEMMQVECWFACNEDGNVRLDCDNADDAVQAVADNDGGYRIQVVKLSLNLPKPREIDGEVTITVNEDLATVTAEPQAV